jgi:bile acid-coenzyme A ligase
MAAISTPAGRPMSMGDAFTYQATRDPNHIAIITSAGQITRGDLDKRANQAARRFRALGVTEGSLVTIALPNGIDFYVAVAAAWKLGAVPQPLSYRLPDLERNAIIELADPAIVVGVAPERVSGRPALAPGWQPDPATEDSPLPSVTAPSWVALTSGGSTGRPKVIVNVRAAECDPDITIVGMKQDGVQLVPGPLYHNGPFTFSVNGLFTGSTIVLMDRFDAAGVLDLIERHRVDWMFAVPTMLRRIWQLPAEVREAADLSSLRVLFSSGSPWPAWLKTEYLNWLGPDKILEMYGGTEQYGSTVITGRESLDHPGSVGRPMGGAAVRILHPETGVDLPPGAEKGIGEVYFMAPGGPGSTYRYLGAEAKSRDGWETLGDLGYLDDEGYLYLVDRRTDMVVSGGANVYPAEVEAALERHPSVRSAAVIGLPDDDLGQRVHAIVDAADSELQDVGALRTHLREHLAPYKVPRTFEIVTEPLRDDAGKVRRSALRDARLIQKSAPKDQPQKEIA